MPSYKNNSNRLANVISIYELLYKPNVADPENVKSLDLIFPLSTVCFDLNDVEEKLEFERFDGDSSTTVLISFVDSKIQFFNYTDKSKNVHTFNVYINSDILHTSEYDELKKNANPLLPNSVKNLTINDIELHETITMYVPNN